MTATDSGTDHSGKGGTVPFFLDPVAADTTKTMPHVPLPGQKNPLG
jgi:hypothetical protein